ncbi:helix-hairpin-helix domain-containing protein [Staphylococcus sp. HL28]|uniref:helix-hairpin-helix domain-containing protein n=1 Tax=Staphylococcus sp. HL28 TaxID=2897335 RepID=UPI001E58F75A|nr:helix-hairpin-helix domain-containing protein [Staphylococcus sp. HL28]UGB07298.1 helix-hairpin-helix domain-containing protein [Staphylococcus sp. HL28]
MYIIIGALIILLLILYIMNSTQLEDKSAYIESTTHSYVDKDNENVKKSNMAKSTNKEEGKKDNQVIYVDIKGAVKHPNVYKMNSSDRMIDILNKAQLLKNADTKQLNFSEKLIDQKLIYVPEKGETIAQQVQSQTHQSIEDGAKTPINLNLATEEQLVKVPGIGPSKAKKIIEYKNQNGSFNSINDLKNIKGFGPKTFEKLKEYFTV